MKLPAAISSNITTAHRRRTHFAAASLQDLGHDACADGLAALADRKTQPILHGDRADQLDRHLDVVPGHHHLHPRGQLDRSEEHTSELQSQSHLVCRLLLEKKEETL